MLIHFFKIENLISLREIALRRTAERVDALRDIYKKYQKVPAIADKILVCVGPGILSPKLVWMGKQLATKLKSPWTTLYIENNEYYRLAPVEQQFIKKSLSLAEQLGGKSEIIQSTQTDHAIMNYARNNNFTKIILGRMPKPKWKKWLFGSLINKLMEKSGNIDIYVVNEDIPTPNLKMQPITQSHLVSYFYTLIIVALCTFLGFPTKNWLDPQSVLMIYLTGVVIVASMHDISAAILASLLSVISYNFFFIYPYYTFFTATNYRISDVVTLAVLLLTGLIISSSTSRLRRQILYAAEREKNLSTLYALGRKLIETPGKLKVANVVSQYIGELFDCAVTVWLPNRSGILELASHPGVTPEIKEASVAQWVFKKNHSAGLGTDTMSSARGYYIPLISEGKVIGVLGLIPKDPNKIFSSDETLILASLAIQSASAFQRINLTNKMESPPWQP